MAETPVERRPGAASVAAAVAWLRSSPLVWPAAVVLVVLLGALLRFHGLGWDQPDGADAPLQMHPDERFLSLVNAHLDWPGNPDAYFDTANSPLNPYNDPDTHSYVYGTFPLFLTKAVANTPGHPFCSGDDYEGAVVCGRKVTALFDTATIALVFFLGAVLFGRAAGLAGALLYALSVLPTQLAHFWTMDPYVTFFGAATLLLSAIFVKAAFAPVADGPPVSIRSPGDTRTVVSNLALASAMGLCIGLGLASKVTAWPIALGPVVAVAIRIGLRDLRRLGLRWQGRRDAPGGHWATDLALLAIAAATAMIVFRIAQPYAFVGPHFWNMSFSHHWLDDIKREVDFQNGNVDYPPFVQWAGRTAYLWPLQNMVLWGLGPALGIAAWAAAGFAAVLLFRRRELTFLLPLALIVAVMAFQGGRFVAYMRYFAPIYPVLCVLAAWGLLGLWRRARAPLAGARERGTRLPSRAWQAMRPGAPPFRWIASSAVVLVFAASAWWALAFQSVYSAEHPRIAASEWIYANVAPGSRITGEIWDDTIPYAVPGHDPGAYPIVALTPYDTDSLQKVQQLVYGAAGPNASGGLNGADYVAITSNRVRDSVTRLPAEYPATIRYYQLLDSGELGFDLVATFKVEPSFLGISIDDSGAEESFTVYDHPEVRIYKKSARWDPARAVQLLDAAHPERAVNLLPRQGRTNGLEMTPSEAQVQQSGGTFTDVFNPGAITSHVPWLWWLVWIELAAFAALPWVSWLFRVLPDRGYGLSKLLGFAAVVLPTWLIVAWGGAHFSAALVWAVYAAAIVLGQALAWRRRHALLADFRARWPSWLAMEAVFLFAFAVFLLIRYFNPDLWYNPQGGEKPIELAYLTAVSRSTTLPPYDPWFAGGVMNYYYMGWFFLAVPIRALRLLPEVAFNLGVPTFAALAAVTAVSTAHNLVALAAPMGALRSVRRRARLRPAIIAGVFGAVLLIGIGNLDSAHQAIERFQHLNVAGINASGPYYHWGLFSAVPFLGGLVGLVSGVYRWLFDGAQLAPFDWWRASRVHFGQFDITEFPYWSSLFGDLHPHLMGLPFFGLTIALCVTYVATVTRGLLRHGYVIAGAMGLALGLERTVHTWDFPTAVVLVVAAVAAGQVLREGRWQQRWWDGVGHLVVAVLLLEVPFTPYSRNFEVFDTGIVRARETTQAQQYFAQFGLFVCFTVAFVGVRLREELAARGHDPGKNPFLAVAIGPFEAMALAVFAVGLAAFTWNFGLTTLALSILLELFLLDLLWLEWRAPGPKHVPRILATGMLAAAVGIAGGVEVVQARNDIVRMNTVFKFGLQAWQLYALGSAFAAWYVGRYLWRADGWRLAARRGRAPAAGVLTAIASVLIIGGALYLWSGTRARQEARFDPNVGPTLNGLAYLSSGATFTEDKGTPNPKDDVTFRLADDLPLIEWLRNNVHGSPVIAEAVGPLYHWTGRISWNTGLPAVIGWDWHEIAYRMDYDYLIQQRRTDTTRFYTDPSTAFALGYLQKYNVSYVVVGTEERVFGTPQGLAKFDQMPQLTPVFRVGNYAIYRFEPS